jgi:drug/metabolite transporter (DMT)-like permease
MTDTPGRGEEVAKPTKGETLGYSLIAMTVVLWSMIEVISKLIQADIPPMTIAFLRFFIGGLCLLPFAIFFGRNNKWRQLGLRDWATLLLLSFLGISLTFSLFHLALYWMDASSTAVIISTVPIFAAPTAFFFLGERVRPIALIGIVLGAAGVFMVYLSETSTWRSALGTIMVLFSVLAFTVYSVLMKRLNQRMDPRFSTPASLWVGSIMMVPLLLLERAPVYRPLPLQSLLILLFLSVFGVGVSYMFYFMGLSKVKASKGVSLMYLKPFLAGFFAVLFLQEAISFQRALSIVIVGLSLYLILEEGRVRGMVRSFTRRRSGP